LTDRETFDRAQAALAARRVGRRSGRPRPAEYAFSGRLVCGTCGRVMQGRRDGASPGYVCSTWREREGCSRNGVREDDLIARLAELLARELDAPRTLDRLRGRLEAQRSGRGDTLRRAAEKGRDHVEALARQLDDGGKRLLIVSAESVPLVERELDRLRQQLVTARAELAEVEKQTAEVRADELDIEALLSRLGELPKLLREAGPEQRKQLVRAAVASVRMRFEVRPPARYPAARKTDRKLTRWAGATVALKGGGKTVYEMAVGGGPARGAAG
jgi:hypothetical protein